MQSNVAQCFLHILFQISSICILFVFAVPRSCCLLRDETQGSSSVLFASFFPFFQKQHIDQDLSQEVAVRLYLDEGDATAAVDLTTPQTLKENLSVLKKDQGGNLPQFTEVRLYRFHLGALKCNLNCHSASSSVKDSCEIGNGK